MSAALPDGVEEVWAAVETVLGRLPEAEAAVLLATGHPVGIYARAEASLAGFGRPDLAITLRVADAAQGRNGPLTPGLAVLALLLGDRWPVTPIALDPAATADVLQAQGAALAADPRRLVVVASGDLSAGLDEGSPRFRIDGAVAWNEALVAAVEHDDADGLGRLGPADALRVAALGWASTVAAQAAWGGPLRVVRYCAPRGVGYLVATGGAVD
ncbi:MAG: hypothetical protein ACRD0K_23155 [Egibacteraceae bacterium]